MFNYTQYFTKTSAFYNWRSVAKIITAVDYVIPGHGNPFVVDKALIQILVDNFSKAQFHDECQDVYQQLTLYQEKLTEQ